MWLLLLLLQELGVSSFSFLKTSPAAVVVALLLLLLLCCWCLCW